jgi:hypothetical protein
MLSFIFVIVCGLCELKRFWLFIFILPLEIQLSRWVWGWGRGVEIPLNGLTPSHMSWYFMCLMI